MLEFYNTHTNKYKIYENNLYSMFNGIVVFIMKCVIHIHILEDITYCIYIYNTHINIYCIDIVGDISLKINIHFRKITGNHYLIYGLADLCIVNQS